MSKVDSVVFVSLAAWQVHRQLPLWRESQQSNRGDKVERRLREGCQGIIAQCFNQHTYSSTTVTSSTTMNAVIWVAMVEYVFVCL